MTSDERGYGNERGSEFRRSSDRLERRMNWVVIPFCVAVVGAAVAMLYFVLIAKDFQRVPEVMGFVRVVFLATVVGLLGLFLYSILEVTFSDD